MAVSTVRPNGQGTRGTWVTQSGGTTSLHLSIDDYLGGGAHDSDTTYVVGPNNGASSLFVLLEDTPANFDPANITSVEIRYTHRKESAGVSNGADVIDIGYQLFRADETTAITTELLKTGVGTTYTQATEALSPTGTHTKTDWDGARLRIRQVYSASGMADTTTRARVTAAEIIINYTTPPPTVTTNAVDQIDKTTARGNATSPQTLTTRGFRVRNQRVPIGIASGGALGSTSRTQAQVEQELDDYPRLGLDIVRADAPWVQMEPTFQARDWTWPDKWIPYAHSKGLRIIATISYSPPWVTGASGNQYVGPSTLAERQAYRDCVLDFLNRYPYIYAIEIWNEPNHSGFWLNPDAVSYTELLKVVYPAVKAAHPNVIVIGGSLAQQGPTEGIQPNTYTATMIAEGALDYMDVFATHPYIENNQDIYWEDWNGPDGSGSWFGPAPSVRDKILTAKPSMKIWFTETGDTQLSTTSIATVSKILDKLISYIAAGWGGDILWYAYRDFDTYSLTDSSYNPRPAYHEFKKEVGEWWDANANYTFNAGSGGSGAYTANFTGLNHSTKHLVLAYGTDANGTGYGGVAQFNTFFVEAGTAIVSIEPSGSDTYTPGSSGSEYIDSGTALVSVVASGTDTIERVYSDTDTALVSIEAPATEAVVGLDQGTAVLSIVAEGSDTTQQTYIPTDWVNRETPLNPTNLMKIENELEAQATLMSVPYDKTTWTESGPDLRESYPLNNIEAALQDVSDALGLVYDPTLWDYGDIPARSAANFNKIEIQLAENSSIIAGGNGALVPPRLPESTGTTYYVGGSGASDANAGTNPAAPWATIDKALDDAPSNAIVKVRAGSYPVTTTVERGGADANNVITIEADDPGNRPTILGGLVIQTIDAKFWRFRYLIFDADGDTAAVKLTRPSLETDCAHDIEFYGCVAFGSIGQGAGFQTTGSEIENIQWWNCIAYDNDQSLTTAHGWYLNGGHNLHVVNCIAINNGGYGFHCYNGSGTQALYDVHFYNCLAASQQLRGGWLIQSDAVSVANAVQDIHLYNCIAAHNDETPGTQFGFRVRYANISDFSGFVPNTMDNCLAFDNSDGATSVLGTGVLVNTGMITSDPLFVNPATEDFHLQSGSPAIGAGLPAYTPSIDFGDAVRVGADIGPYDG